MSREPEESPKFMVDAMLGTLAKWLRLLGYDAEYADSSYPDSEIVRRARSQGRIILTRDRELALHRKGVNAILIESEELGEQLLQLKEALGLDFDRLGSRCVECNVPLVSISREEARPLVPPYVYQTQTEFRICPKCGRVYWRATHWEKIQEKLKQLLSENDTEG